ncbi:MAG: lipid-A-disaccharide synthase [Alphaproteobacteria bacterium]
MTTAADPEPGGGPLVFLIAGEVSGDALGGRLMAALKRKTGGRVRFAGVGGETMAAEGLQSLFPITEISLMGAAEILPHLRRILRRIDQTADAVRRLKPAALVTIDSPAFGLRVAGRVRGLGLPLIHYVAPSVWAYRPGRARKLARRIDHLLCLLPFEPPYFDAVGLANTFVGHPAVAEPIPPADGQAFRDRHGIPADAPVLCVLPGSRRTETERLLPVFGATVAILAADHPRLRVVVPTVPGVAADVQKAVEGWSRPVTVCDGTEKWDAFAACDAALAASGTVTLELARLKKPMVVAYRMHPLTSLYIRLKARVKFVSLLNIVLGRAAVPEYLLGACQPERLAPAVARLLDDVKDRAAQIEATQDALRLMGAGGLSPSDRAADVVLGLLGPRS